MPVFYTTTVYIDLLPAHPVEGISFGSRWDTGLK